MSPMYGSFRALSDDDWTGDKLNKNNKNPYIFVHQILPARIWAQSDMCLLIDCTAVLAMLATFSFLVPPFPLQGQLFFNATTKHHKKDAKKEQQ
ncbi:hypothetical protein TYRP_011635 [Tyrophagus putrescentiae]|nr:hypothetical protein TYRP_011635 [Tyrophagus putrescentiae]